MNEKDVRAIESLAKVLSEIDENKLWIVAIVLIVLIISFCIRWYLSWKSKQQTQFCIDNLLSSLTSLSDSLSSHEKSSGERVLQLTKVMEEIRDRQRNVIGKSDSIKIILNKFNEVIENEIIRIFEWSIVNNDYKSRADFVRKKVKSKLAEQISVAHRSLKQFRLSVDLEKFFVTYVDDRGGNIHFKIVDQLWDSVEKVYHKENYSGKNIMEQQLEEMQVEVNNAITTELTKIQAEINDVYGE